MQVAGGKDGLKKFVSGEVIRNLNTAQLDDFMRNHFSTIGGEFKMTPEALDDYLYKNVGYMLSQSSPGSSNEVFSLLANRIL